MPRVTRDELEAAFRHYWGCGAIAEDWGASYAAACKAHDPEHAKKMTRLHWGNGPAWTRGGRSFAERPPVPRR
jgi:hypothetical protein